MRRIGRVRYLSRPYSECSRRTASSAASASISTENLISEVVIARMLMLALGQRLEHLGGDAGMAAHADADDRDLGDVVGAVQPIEADRGPRLLEHLAGALEIGRRHGEGDVGGQAVLRHVLHDHVDVDAGLGQRPEDRRRDARACPGTPADRDLGLVLGIGDAGDDLLFHDLLLVADEGAGTDAMADRYPPARRSSSARRSAPCAPWPARPSASAAPWRRARPFPASPRRRSRSSRRACGTMRGSVV